jgi:Fic family protein
MLFTIKQLTPKEKEVVEVVERLRQDLRWHARDTHRWMGRLQRFVRARALQGSNSIEGHNISDDDALAAVDNAQPVETNEENEDWRAVIGYRNAMTYVLQLADDPNFEYSEALIRSLHFMIMSHNLAKHPGLLRHGSMYVKREATGEIVYTAPDIESVRPRMKELVTSLNEDGHNEMPVLVRAALAHLNLAMIHPFSDGNGRAARCIQTLVLARERILSPDFCSIEEYIGYNREDYYRVLGEVGKGAWHPENDAHPWIQFCLTAHYRQAQTVLRRARQFERVWNELEIEVTALKLPDRLILALHDATFGYRVSNVTYRVAAEISENLASRDLRELADRGLLKAIGDGRGRSYVASDILRAIRTRTTEPKKQDDPFEVGELQISRSTPAQPDLASDVIMPASQMITVSPAAPGLIAKLPANAGTYEITPQQAKEDQNGG